MRAVEFLTEKWSNKYKRSINCNNPKGFSQKAHCAGRKKNEGAEITMWTNPEYQGADVDDKYYKKQPAKLIDVSKLTPFEPADKMDDGISAANMGKLVTAIQAGEKINPVVITKHQGKWLIIDGHHRYFAHLKAGVDKIRVVVADPKDLTWRDDVPIDEADENLDNCKYGKYYCSTDKKWKCRKGPKQTREEYNFVREGVGIITKQNTTDDVKPGETQRQAKKLGMYIDSKGSPPLLHKKAAKNSDPNTLSNLGIGE